MKRPPERGPDAPTPPDSSQSAYGGFGEYAAPTWPDARNPSAPAVYAPPRVARKGSRLGCAGRAVLVALLVVVVLSGFGAWRLSATVTSYPAAHFNSGKNAVWIEHTWAGDAHTADEFDALAARLRREQMAYVFAHVGPLTSEGTIPRERAAHAAELVAALHARLPGVRVLAWVGQLEVAANLPNEEMISLEDSAVRGRIAQTSAAFVRRDGFDGVHYDIEPIVNNNPRFLDLLDETRAAMPGGAMLSISGAKWAPNATLASMAYDAGKLSAWWTSYYYAAVAAHVDQIAALTYNTGMPTAGTYRLMLKQETQHILEAVRSVHTPPEVLIGIPSYAGDNPWFHDRAENVGTALAGITDGLNSSRETAPFTGVALYRLATTNDDEWRDYERTWLGLDG